MENTKSIESLLDNFSDRDSAHFIGTQNGASFYCHNSKLYSVKNNHLELVHDYSAKPSDVIVIIPEDKMPEIY